MSIFCLAGRVRNACVNQEISHTSIISCKHVSALLSFRPTLQPQLSISWNGQRDCFYFSLSEVIEKVIVGGKKKRKEIKQWNQRDVCCQGFNRAMLLCMDRERGHSLFKHIMMASHPLGRRGKKRQEIMEESGRWTKIQPGANCERQCACLLSPPLQQCQVRPHHQRWEISHRPSERVHSKK